MSLFSLFRPGSNNYFTYDHLKCSGSAVMVMSDVFHTSMMKHLLRNDGKERVSFLHVNTKRDDDGSIQYLYVRSVNNLPDEEYERQEIAFVCPGMPSLIKNLSAFAESYDEAIFHVHSHPFAAVGEFSSVDLRTMDSASKTLKDFLLATRNGKPPMFGMMVVGQDPSGFSAELSDGATMSRIKITSLRIEGKNGQRKIRSYNHNVKRSNFSLSLDAGLLDRNIRWLGNDGQDKLAKSKVLIIGAGGAGSSTAQQLRGLGVEEITIMDADNIEISNLNRLPGATLSDVGKPKVMVAKRMIEDVACSTKVTAIQEHFDLNRSACKNAAAEADIIIGAVDRFKVRFDIQLLAARCLKPYIDLGSGILVDSIANTVRIIGGQVAFYYPGGPCLCCQAVVPRDIESDLSVAVKKATGYVRGTDSDFTPTSVVTINSIVAGFAVDQMIRYLTGFAEVKPFISVDLLKSNCMTYEFRKNPECMICGNEGVEGTGCYEEESLFRIHTGSAAQI